MILLITCTLLLSLLLLAEYVYWLKLHPWAAKGAPPSAHQRESLLWAHPLILPLALLGGAIFCLGVAWQLPTPASWLNARLLWIGLGALLTSGAVARVWRGFGPRQPPRSPGTALVPHRSAGSARGHTAPGSVWQQVRLRAGAVAGSLVVCWLLSGLIARWDVHTWVTDGLPTGRAVPTSTVARWEPSLVALLDARSVAPSSLDVSTQGAALLVQENAPLPTEPVTEKGTPPPPRVGGPVGASTPPSHLLAHVYPTGLITDSNGEAAHGPGLFAVVTAAAGAHLREEPSTQSAILGIVPTGTRLDVIGQTVDSRWVQVRLPGESHAWVFTDLTSGIQKELP